MAHGADQRIGGELNQSDIPIGSDADVITVTIDATAATELSLTAGTATLQEVVDAIVATFAAL